MIALVCLAGLFSLVNLSGVAAAEHKPQPLDKADMMKKKNMACDSCHPGGTTTGGEVETPMPSEVTGKPYKLPVPSLVGSAATFPKFKIPNDEVMTIGQISNNCTMMFLGSKPLDLSSKEAFYLTAYLTSLSEGKTVEAGKMPEMMKKIMEK